MNIALVPSLLIQESRTYTRKYRDLVNYMKAHHRLELTTYRQQFDLFEQQIALYLNERSGNFVMANLARGDCLFTIPGTAIISTSYTFQTIDFYLSIR
jgi:hypothetical protein